MPDDEANQAANSAPSSDDPEFLKDLRRYNNPEVFDDPSLPQYYRFQVPSFPEPSILSIEVNGDGLPNALRERFFALTGLGPKAGGALLKGFDSWERDMLLFFVRHLPLLTVRLYKTLETMSVLKVLAEVSDDPRKQNETLKQILRILLPTIEHDLKQILGTRRRLSKLDAKTRQSLHTWYDEIHQGAKVIKKHYEETFVEFEKSHRRTGHTRKEWQEFWANHAQQRYGYEEEFVALFAESGRLSASEVAYTWMAQKTGHTSKYVKRLVMDARALARKKVTIKR
jgi:hypothetical protein